MVARHGPLFARCFRLKTWLRSLVLYRRHLGPQRRARRSGAHRHRGPLQDVVPKRLFPVDLPRPGPPRPGCLGAKGAHSETFFRPLLRIGRLLPESKSTCTSTLPAAAPCPLGQRPARRASAQHGFLLCSRAILCGGAAARGRGGQRQWAMLMREREQQGARIAVVPPVRGGSCAAPRSGRARSKHRRRPQLCAKPPLQRLAARHPSASRLPSFRRRKSQLKTLAWFPRPVWPHALAAGGTSAHLAATRGCGPTQTGDRARPDRGAAQLPPRTGGTTTLSTHHPNLAG